MINLTVELHHLPALLGRAGSEGLRVLAPAAPRGDGLK